MVGMCSRIRYSEIPKLLTHKKISFEGLITSRYSIDNINIAIDKMRSGASAGRILLIYEILIKLSEEILMTVLLLMDILIPSIPT